MACCALLVCLLAGCQREPKYAVWRVGGKPAERVQVENGLVRTACELILQRLEKKDREAFDLIASLNRQAVSYGIKATELPPLMRYSCEPEE